MRILVTGGAGFIASNLARRLLSSEHQLVLVDNFLSNYSTTFKRLRTEELLNSVGLKILEVDLVNLTETINLFESYMPEIVIHCAAQPGVRLPVEQYHLYINNNVIAFQNILAASKKTSIAKILYASSSSVYDDIKTDSFSERATALNPKSFYGLTKKWNEESARHYSERFGLVTRGLRFFTVYGPWGRPDMAYFRLMSAALEGSKFTLFGNGSVQRDFTYIDDVTLRIEKLMDDLTTQSEGFCDVVNIGGQAPLSMVELIKTIEQTSGRKINFQYGDSNVLDLLKTEANKEYGNSIFGDIPYTPLSQGIAKMYEWAISTKIKGQLSSWL